MQRLQILVLLALLLDPTSAAASEYSGLDEIGDCLKAPFGLPSSVVNCYAKGSGDDDHWFPVLKQAIAIYDYKCPAEIEAFSHAKGPRGSVFVVQCGYNKNFRYRIEIDLDTPKLLSVRPTIANDANDVAQY